MADIAPSSFNPFTAVSKAIGDASGRAMNFQQSAAMVQLHHAAAMEQLHAGHALSEQSAKAAHRRDLATKRITHQQAIDLETHKAGLAAQAAATQHEHTINAAHVQAGLAEQAATSTQSRNLELLKGIRNSAQGGTEVKFKSGELSFGFTKKQTKPRAAKQTASAPVVQATAETKTPKFAHRDPVTRRITDYKDYPQEPLKPSKPARKKK